LGVLLDSTFGHHQVGGNPGVRVSLGHQFQNLALSLRQGVDRVIAPLPAEDLVDDLGINGETAVGHPFHRIQELIDVTDPVLQEITDSRPPAASSSSA
jgi:hypothetical protein